MKLCRELVCENYEQINSEIRAWIQHQNLTVSKDFWNPINTKQFLYDCALFFDWCKQSDLPIKSIAVTVGHDADCCAPHIDTPPARFKLSWPVFNTTDTWNCWYEVNCENPTVMVNTWGGRIYPDRSQLSEIHRRQVTAPALIDAGIIHDVTAGKSAQWPRIGLQCQLFKEPEQL